MKFPSLLCVLAFSITTISSCKVVVPNLKCAEYPSLKECVDVEIKKVGCDRSKVTELSLQNQNIATLPSGVFSAFTGLHSLTNLDLSNNKIPEIDGFVFQGLTSLSQLTLRFNYIQTISFAAFWSQRVSLQLVNLNSNNLTTLPSMLFNGLNNLTGIGLNKNKITTLPGDIFAKLPALQSINLDYNRIETLPGDIFAKLPALKSIGLSYNQIKALPADIFTDLPALHFLSADPLLICRWNAVAKNCRQVAWGIVYWNRNDKYVQDGSLGFFVSGTNVTA